MANINNIQVQWVVPTKEAYNEEVSTPIVNSIRDRYVTYMDLVMFGTLTGFGFSNPGTITTWEQFLRALETIVNGLNTRISNLENATPGVTTTVSLNPSTNQTITGPTDVTAIIGNPVGSTTWSATNIGTSGNKFSKTENGNVITITPLNTASIKGSLSIDKTEGSGYVILTASFTQGAANSYNTTISATNNGVTSSSIKLTYNNTRLSAASTYTWKGINYLPAGVTVSYPNSNQIKLTASSTVNIPANTISVANANASEDAKYGNSITIDATPTPSTIVSITPSTDQTINSSSGVSIQANVINGSGTTTWTLTNSGSANTQTFSYTGSGNNITVKPNYINNAANLQGTISGSQTGGSQLDEYGFVTFLMTFVQSTSNITNVSYSTNVYATNNGIGSNSIKVTYSKSNTKLSAGNYSVSGLPSGLSSTISGSTISIRNYGTNEIIIPANTLIVSNDNASNTWTNSSNISVPGKSVPIPTTTYYWYVGQTPPESTSVNPSIVTGAVPGWHEIGTSIGTYTFASPLYNSDANPISSNPSRNSNWYVAVPSTSSLGVYDSDDTNEVNAGNWVSFGNVSINNVQYDIYQSVGSFRNFIGIWIH